MARVLGWANESFPSFNEITLQITQESTDQETPEREGWSYDYFGGYLVFVNQQQKMI